ncbi:ArnT family glycosyltransferase [Asticcacaulis endophyticus]|uniref:Glycosyltransferase RgtA/B/C/D-like domain-containing protein n=1 Tax=Asticcacaulis endophyticus TaxID=1395890 RepID=A0A918PSV3_9CAUL|nr:glycosyltransferase family 39 protein [Asticcacaulis endophyticus]GGZ20815.1 hypothetical protein GCM10011273_01790 [Asticcacaulis endophyticus]
MTSDTAAPRLSLTHISLLAIAALTVVRVALLFTTYLDLYPDEAQYWLWSRELDFGYYSKPPMIAWVIHLATAIGGNGEGFVRLFAPLLHAGSATALLFAGTRLYNEKTGALAALIYSLMPGVVLSSGVISTDACLLFFLSLSLLVYVEFLHGRGKRPLFLAFLLGLTFGGAFLSKYACLYFLLGAVIHAAFDPRARSRWSWQALLIWALTFACVIAPNIIWNATHGFQTVAHTADNANWQADSLFHPLSMLKFLSHQFGVFGPVPFGMLVIGLIAFSLNRASVSPDTELGGGSRNRDLMLICFALPPLVFVTIQALLSRAHANWAASSYVPGSLLAATWLYGVITSLPYRRKGVLKTAIAVALWAGLAFQVAVAGVFMYGITSPEATQAMGMASGMKRARGWEAATQTVLAEAEVALARGEPLSAIAVDDRFLYNSMAYYGRDWFKAHPDIPLKNWVREINPHSHSETHMPLTAETGRHVLLANLTERFVIDMRQDFKRTSEPRLVQVPIDHKRLRDVRLFYGYDFARAPRDPATGHPIVDGKVHE